MNCRLHRLYLRPLSVLLCSLILLQTAIAGQSGIGLTITVLDGNGAQNIISETAPKPITVRVVDRTGRPLPGASVQFVAPDFGPGGGFGSNSNSVTIVTDRGGMATAPQFQANSSSGDFQIQIVATYMGEVTRFLLPQRNVARKKSSMKMLILSAVAGGAAAAAFAAKRGGGAASPTSPTPQPGGATTAPTITFSQSSIGAPQ